MPGHRGAPGGRKPRLLRSSDGHRCTPHCTRCTLHCNNKVHSALHQPTRNASHSVQVHPGRANKQVPGEGNWSPPQIADLGPCIAVPMFQNQELSNALSKFSERFTLNSFLPPPRLSLPNLHAITLGGTPALHVSYRKFHNSCKQDRCSAAGCPLKQPHLPLLLPLLIFPLFLLLFLLSLVPCCFSHPFS